jgi:peroxiredoxin
MKRMMIGFAVLLLAVSVAATAFAAGEEQQEKFGSKVGEKLAPFSIPDPTTDKSYSIKELAAGGKDVALVFMQSACTLCVAEINEFVGASDELQGKLNVALVSVDFDAGRLKPYKDAYKIPFPLLHDKEGKVIDIAGFNSTPATIILGANGVVKKRIDGYDRAAVKGLVKEYSK